MQSKSKARAASIAKAKGEIDDNYRELQIKDEVSDFKLSYAECNHDELTIYQTIGAGMREMVAGRTKRFTGVRDSLGLKPRALRK